MTDKTFRFYELPKTTQDRLDKALTNVSQEILMWLGDYGENYYITNCNKFIEEAEKLVKGLNHSHVFNYFDTMLKIHKYTWLYSAEKYFNTNKDVVLQYFHSVLKGASDAREALAKKKA